MASHKGKDNHRGDEMTIEAELENIKERLTALENNLRETVELGGEQVALTKKALDILDEKISAIVNEHYKNGLLQ